MRKIILISLVAVFANGCATIVNSSKQTVSFMSEPEGATVTVGGEFTAETPTAMPLKRGQDYTILVQKEGYKTESLNLNSGFDHWVQATLGNIWNYIIPGMIVDAASGGAYEFDRTLINVKLKRDETTQSKPVPRSDGNN